MIIPSEGYVHDILNYVHESLSNLRSSNNDSRE